MANNNQAPEVYLTRFDESNSSFVLDEESSEIFKGDLSPRGYQIPLGYDGTGASWHEWHVDDLPVFDFALGFRSSSFFDVASPYGNGFHSRTSGSGVTNSNPSYASEYVTTSSRIYNYFSSILNDHDDFIFSNTTVDTLAIISFRNRKLGAGIKEGSCQIKHDGTNSNSYLVSDFWNDMSYVRNTSSVSGPRTFLIEKGTSDYNETILNNSDHMLDRIVGKVYPNEGIILLDLVKLTFRDAGGNFEKDESLDWKSWNTSTAVSRVVSSSYSWSLDRAKETIKYLRILNKNFMPKRVYFCKGNMKQFNMTTNPTFFATGSRGQQTTNPLFDPTFTYITSVGLYSEDNELMAIGKLNKPLKKDHTSEFHLTAKVSY